MTRRRFAPMLLALIVALGLLPLSPASAARNRPPRIKKAVMKDTDGDGMANKVVLTYNEKIKHRLDRDRRYPFKVQGYTIKKIKGARGTTKLQIVLKESRNAPLKPPSISYTRTRKQPVRDMKKLQAAKQLLTKNIIGLTPTTPPPGQHTLTVRKNGQGSVSSDPAGIECGATCASDSGNFANGTSVTLTAVPGAEAAPEVTWSGSACSTSTATTCTVTMDAAKTIDVTFAAAGTRTMVVTHAGDGAGSVTSSPSGVNCGPTCWANFDDSVTLVTLTATPSAGSKLASWGGDATCPTSSTTCDILMDGNKSVTVTFELLPLHMLSVAIDSTGTGSGIVTSSPAGITCGSDCNHEFSEGTTVTLTADPADDSEFAGWSGDAGCEIATCEIPMSAAKSVTAKFNTAGTGPVMHQLTVTKSEGEIACLADDGGTACNGSYEEGTVVTITATKDPEWPLNVVPTWTGCDTPVLNICTVTMNAGKVVHVSWGTV